MTRILFVLAILIIIVVVSFFTPSGFRIFSFESDTFSTDPVLIPMLDQKMLVVKVTGDPDHVGEVAFGLLFQVYYGLSSVPKGNSAPAPRARWTALDVDDRSTWTGRYAMPVPDKITELPVLSIPDGYEIELTTWEYGEVAQIGHLGAYSEEGPAIERLMAFIASEGYEIIGDHEEEYLFGPGTEGFPEEEYFTIIRYNVRKR